MEALEDAYTSLEELGWGRPIPDGGLGDPSAFDLYLDPAARFGAEARSDGRAHWSYLDAVSAHAVVDPFVPAAELGSCVTTAYAEAILLGLDPAEARTWRRATASWLSLEVTGRFGCGDGVATQQAEPWRSPIASAAELGAGGALFLSYLSDRHGRRSGRFIRDLWNLARQRTWEGVDLRASPDLWEALDARVQHSEDSLDELVQDYAVARWFAGDPSREPGSPVPALTVVPASAALRSTVDRIAWSELPEHSPIASPPLQPFGNGYVSIDVRQAPTNATLRLWLRGEYGVRWSLVALRLDENYRELGRMTAAPRERTPRSYLPVSIFDGTATVVVVVTNLSSRRPDADTHDPNVRSFRLIADGAAADSEAPAPEG